MSSVLVVEDESAIAELIAINLRHAGHDVTLAGTAEQAQHAIGGALPDLVLLDWMLPGESGLQLARRWRSDPRTRELPIIMLTARADEGDKIVGETPILASGERFSYNSCHVAHIDGRASGSFHGIDEFGARIFVRIPAFDMTIPRD